MTNLYIKDGQQPPKTIHYNLGNFGVFTFDGFVDESMASLYSRRKFKKSSIMFTDGLDNNLMSILLKKEGKKFPKNDHWVDVYGYLIMTVVWRPSGKIKFARYIARDKTLYMFLRKNYPNGKWMDKPPKWIKEK